MQDKRSNNGGKRAGAGRPVVGRKVTQQIRVEESIFKTLKKIKVQKKYNNYSDLIKILVDLYNSKGD